MRVAMRKPAAVATVVLSLGLVVPASAATADPHASCSGLVGPYYAEQGSGTHSDVTLGVVREFQSAGMPPGANFSDFASFHDGTAEVCLG
jgi:hypothetical protein